jgi:hypothetical protein
MEASRQPAAHPPPQPPRRPPARTASPGAIRQVVIAREVDFTIIDVGTQGDSPGDTIVFTDDLFDQAGHRIARVGSRTAGGRCTSSATSSVCPPSALRRRIARYQAVGLISRQVANERYLHGRIQTTIYGWSMGWGCAGYSC